MFGSHIKYNLAKKLAETIISEVEKLHLDWVDNLPHELREWKTSGKSTHPFNLTEKEVLHFYLTKKEALQNEIGNLSKLEKDRLIELESIPGLIRVQQINKLSNALEYFVSGFAYNETNLMDNYSNVLLYLFKINYLKSQISHLEPSTAETDTNTHEDEEKHTETDRKTVEKYFKFMLKNDPRKHKQCLSTDDHAKLVKWVTAYFDNELEVPEIKTPINNCYTAYGNVCKTFLLLFKKIRPYSTYPESLWVLVRSCFIHLQHDTGEKIRTRKPSGDYETFSGNRIT